MCEHRGVWVKYNLLGDLAKYWGIRDVSNHVGREPWVSRGPRPLPSSSIISRAFVAKVVQDSDICTVLDVLPAWTCLEPSAFCARPLRASLADYKASRSVPGG